MTETRRWGERRLAPEHRPVVGLPPRQHGVARSSIYHILPIVLCIASVVAAGAMSMTITNATLAAVEVAVTLLVWLPALLLADADSAALPGYVIATWVFVPEVRRVVDWAITGSYNPITIISLVPLLCTFTMTIPVMRRMRDIPRELRLPLTLAVLSVGYGSILGIIFHGKGAIYEAAMWLVPLLIIPYMASRVRIERERTRWLRQLALIAFIAAVYAWFQFVVAPPWDMLWLVGSRMTSSMGQPNPLEFRAFSTLNSAGTAGAFFALALIPPLLNRRWRGFFSYLGVAVIASALAITQVRIGWLMTAAAAGGYIALSRGADRGTTLGAVVLVGAALFFALPYLPGGDRVLRRAQTLQHLEADDSMNVRLDLSTEGLVSVLDAPFGTGVGAGVAGKLATGDIIVNTDNGYLGILLTLGVPMGVLFLTSLILISRELFALARETGLGNTHFARLGLAGLIAAAIGTAAINMFTGSTAVFIWFVTSLAFGPRRNGPRPK